MTNTIAIAGSFGLVGSAVARASAGYRVLSPRWCGKSGWTCEEDLETVFALVHCAGVRNEDFGRYDPDAIPSQRMISDFRVLLRRSAIEKVVYVSSAHVYGNQQGPVSEQTQTMPSSPYGLAHHQAEEGLRRICADQGVSLLIVRPGLVYGLPDLRRFTRWGLIPFSFPLALHRTGAIRLETDGLQVVSMVSSERIGSVVRAFVDGNGSHYPQIINLCSYQTTVRDFALRCIRMYSRLWSNRPPPDLVTGQKAGVSQLLGSSHPTGGSEDPDSFIEQLFMQLEELRSSDPKFYESLPVR